MTCISFLLVGGERGGKFTVICVAVLTGPRADGAALDVWRMLHPKPFQFLQKGGATAKLALLVVLFGSDREVDIMCELGIAGGRAVVDLDKQPPHPFALGFEFGEALGRGLTQPCSHSAAALPYAITSSAALHVAERL